MLCGFDAPTPLAHKRFSYKGLRKITNQVLAVDKMDAANTPTKKSDAEQHGRVEDDALVRCAFRVSPIWL